MMQQIHKPGNHSALTAANPGRRAVARFSLRRLLYSSPIVARCTARRSSGNSKHFRISNDHGSSTSGVSGRQVGVIRLSEVSENDAVMQDNRKTTSEVSTFGISAGNGDDAHSIECPLCLTELPVVCFPELRTCSHRSCYDCFQQYLKTEIYESRVIITCPECSAPMHPCDIQMILNDRVQYEKYESFMVRRVLAVDPDTRWCPAPDCGFAVIANGCASCPKIKCERPGCNTYFCYHCKAEWHPDQTCDAAEAQRSQNVRSSFVNFIQGCQYRADIKSCPRCQVPISKMRDGSCNQMICALCGAEFCWLCMKEITYVHFLSPSGCTFWGKKCWSKKKKIICQLGTLIGAPVGIGLMAVIAVSAITVGIPVWVGRRLYVRYQGASRQKRNWMIASGIVVSVFVSPLLAALAVAIAVPILLIYIYGVVPVSLCQFTGCGTSKAGAGVRSNSSDENELLEQLATRNSNEVDHRGCNPPKSRVSLSKESLDRENDRESATYVAWAGANIGNSIASSLLSRRQRPVVQVNISPTQIFNMNNKAASAATNLSGKCVAASTDDDRDASAGALAGSLPNSKMDSTSLSTCQGIKYSDPRKGVTIHTDSMNQRVEVADPTS